MEREYRTKDFAAASRRAAPPPWSIVWLEFSSPVREDKEREQKGTQNSAIGLIGDAVARGITSGAVMNMNS